MKTTAKDVILLCKGWYDKGKYPTISEALKQYYRKNYCDDMEEYLNESYLLKIVLEQTMQEIVRYYPDRMFGFVNSYLIIPRGIFCYDNNSNQDYDCQLFYRITRFLASLQMNGDGFIEIDTEEYFEKYIANDETGEIRTRLKEDII